MVDRMLFRWMDVYVAWLEDEERHTRSEMEMERRGEGATTLSSSPLRHQKWTGQKCPRY